MPSKINLIGKRFGRLLVTSSAPARNKKTFWHCVCNCGCKVTVRADSLIEQKTVSCGCFHTEYVRSKKGTRANTGSLSKFEARYIPEPNSGCWLWTGGINPDNGYARFWGPDSNSVYAHQFSYRKFKGPIPRGLVVRHTCDVKICVNPDHLLIGTSQDNVADAVARNIHAHGEKHGMAQLTKEQVDFIRTTSLGSRALAQHFKISQTHVNRIRAKSAWR